MAIDQGLVDSICAAKNREFNQRRVNELRFVSLEARLAKLEKQLKKLRAKK